MSKLSIVVPVYYNEDNLRDLYSKLKSEVFDKIDSDYELIFVDDGSKDNSYEVMKELQKKDECIVTVKLSRNFGSHLAILAGFSHSTGDCLTAISADLQDPPEIIIEMYEKWKAGSKVVLAVREDREEPFLQKMFSNSYYRIMRSMALPNMPKGGFDCFLIDDQVVQIINQIEEKNSSIMGLILWCGFKTEMIYYVRKKREVGKSRWTLSKKIKLFIDSMLSFSYIPIRLISMIGLIFSLASFIWGIFLVVNRINNNIAIQGWTTMMLILLFVSGLIMLMLGIIGEYLWRTFDETRNRPAYIIDEYTKGGANNE